MPDNPLLKKLRMMEGHRSAVLNAPDGYVSRLNPLAPDVTDADGLLGQFDFVHIFVHNQAELEMLGPRAIAAVNPDGVFWISYPKGTSNAKTDINRDRGWDVVTREGFRAVAQVSIDDTWSALRFRPGRLVKSRGDRS